MYLGDIKVYTTIKCRVKFVNINFNSAKWNSSCKFKFGPSMSLYALWLSFFYLVLDKN